MSEPRIVKRVGCQTIVEYEGRYYLRHEGGLTPAGYWAFGLTLDEAERHAELFKDGYLANPTRSDP